MYALHQSSGSETFKKTLLGHLQQLVDAKGEKSNDEAHLLLVRMFIFSPDFDLVN